MTAKVRSIFSIIIAVAVTFGAAGCVKGQGFFDNPLIGKKTPDFTLQTAKGAQLRLGNVIGGRKAVLFFWATWCPHCREQLTALSASKAELEKKGVVIVLVDVGEPRNVVLRFLQMKNLDFTTFLDADTSVAQEYQVVGVPTIVFIGSDGKVRDSLHVFPDEYMDILK